ncbi:MAG: hypothetical protein EOP36_11055 [Rubrivivax sp.]|nr:MAG: hypothetical protein EOP36_11055 [Rubrivivax sp.]
MDDHFWRLLWALPLVLLIGVGAMLLLKRLGIGVGPRAAAVVPDATSATPTLVSSTPLTDHTRALVVECGAQRWVVFESTAQIAVHAPTPTSSPTPDPTLRRS